MKPRILAVMVSILLISILGLHTSFHEAKADYYRNYTFPNATGIPLSQSKLIGIQLAQSCISMIKNNITSLCPTYDKLVKFDNTNPVFAGKWVTDPYYHRLAPRVLNHYNFNPHPFVVMVDPNSDYTARARMIIIEPQNFSWNDPNEKMSNGIIKIHVNRFVTSCETANIAPLLWLLNDTIHYLESDCTKTGYNDTSFYVQKQKAFSFANPFSSLHYYNYTHTLKQSTIKNCINFKCKYKDPYSNW